jgi:hypothetical protein
MGSYLTDSYADLIRLLDVGRRSSIMMLDHIEKELADVMSRVWEMEEDVETGQSVDGLVAFEVF